MLVNLFLVTCLGCSPWLCHQNELIVRAWKKAIKELGKGQTTKRDLKGAIGWSAMNSAVELYFSYDAYYCRLYNELCKTRVLIGLEECVI